MFPEQRYWFDLTGYLHLAQVLQGDELTRVQDAAKRYLNTPPGQRQGSYELLGKEYHQAIGFDPVLDALAVHPTTWPIIREFTKGRPQLSGSGITNNKQGEGGLPLHCAREDYGYDVTRYEVRDGEILCNDCVIFFYLDDVHPGDGGLLIVPGSHRANFDRPEGLYNGGTITDEIPPGVVNVTPKAGDVVLFSELTTHGVSPWKPVDRERRMVNYRYKVHVRGWEHRFSDELKAALSPELLELVRDEDYMNAKDIGSKDVVELT